MPSVLDDVLGRRPNHLVVEIAPFVELVDHSPDVHQYVLLGGREAAPLDRGARRLPVELNQHPLSIRQHVLAE